MNYAAWFGLDSCVKCSVCISYCPVVRVFPRFAGPKRNGPDLERFRLESPEADFGQLAYCTNCKSCDVACPSGVKVSAMIARAKGELVAGRGASFRDRLLVRTELLGRAGRFSPALVGWLAQNRPLRRLGEKIFGISAEMTLPRFARKTFYELYALKEKFLAGNFSGGGHPAVVYFPGCYALYNRPEVGLAVVEVLAGNGVRVLVEEKFNCCGLPLIANGFLAGAKKLAERNIFLLEKCFERGFRVVTSCPSCKLTLQREYGELLGLGNASLRDGRVVDVFEFLLAKAGLGELAGDFNPLPVRVGYHRPCHLKAAGCGAPSRELLGLVPGLTVVDLDAGCCGLSGSYGFKRENYANSMAIGEELFRAVKETGVELVATECGACQLQIAHGTGAAVCHPGELLARAYGRPRFSPAVKAGGD